MRLIVLVVGATHPEPTPTNTGNNLKPLLSRRLASKAQRCKVLNTSYFVARCSIILGNLGFDHNVWIELTRDNKIRRLVESRDTFRAFSLSVAYACRAQDVLNGSLQAVANQTRY